MAAHTSSSNASASSGALPRPLLIALGTIAIAGVLALLALIVRELSPHHAVVHAGARPEATSDEATVAPPTVAPPPAATVVRPEVTAAPVATQAAPAPRPDGLVQIRALASIIHDPTSAPSEGVFHNRVTGDEQYSYDGFGPFRRGELKRDANHPEAWEVDGSNGPGKSGNVEDLAPRGGTREAATIRDDKGNVVGTWYSVEAGPLAPAFATVMASGGTRIVSRPFLEANRSSFPAALTAVLDH